MADSGAETPSGIWRRQRRLKNFLIDRSMQLRFTLTMVVISAVLTSGLGWVVMSKAREATRVVAVRAMDPTDPAAAELLQQFMRNDRLLLVALAGFGLMLCVLLAGYGIVLTHKVAGPLFKVSLYLDKIRDGKLGQVYNLRKGDQLVEFFDHFKGAHDALRVRTSEDIALIERILPTVTDPAAKAELVATKARKEQSLK